jgi:hypothetical protein
MLQKIKLKKERSRGVASALTLLFLLSMYLIFFPFFLLFFHGMVLPFIKK